LGDRRVITILFGLVLLLVIPLSLDGTVFADYDDDDDDDNKFAKHHDDYDDDDDDDDKKNTTKIIHLGFLQLAAHDFFNVSRCLESDLKPEDELKYPFDNFTFKLNCEIKDSENGKLDLSTVLFDPKGGDCDFKKSIDLSVPECTLYSSEDIKNGGEIRSRENIMIFTAGALVGEKYSKFVDEYGEKIAYKKTLKYYHKQLKKAYEESFHLNFPTPKDGDVTNLHNLAVRAGHDFLPAEIVIKGVPNTSLFDPGLIGEKLSKEEQKQESSPVDGEFDIEFTGIDFCPFGPSPPFPCIKVNLLVADQSFGKQFGLLQPHMDEDTFDDFMDELKDGKFNKKDEVSKLLKQAFAFGLSFD